MTYLSIRGVADPLGSEWLSYTIGRCQASIQRAICRGSHRAA